MEVLRLAHDSEPVAYSTAIRLHGVAVQLLKTLIDAGVMSPRPPRPGRDRRNRDASANFGGRGARSMPCRRRRQARENGRGVQKCCAIPRMGSVSVTLFYSKLALWLARTGRYRAAAMAWECTARACVEEAFAVEDPWCEPTAADGIWSLAALGRFSAVNAMLMRLWAARLLLEAVLQSEPTAEVGAAEGGSRLRELERSAEERLYRDACVQKDVHRVQTLLNGVQLCVLHDERVRLALETGRGAPSTAQVLPHVYAMQAVVHVLEGQPEAVVHRALEAGAEAAMARGAVSADAPRWRLHFWLEKVELARMRGCRDAALQVCAEARVQMNDVRLALVEAQLHLGVGICGDAAHREAHRRQAVMSLQACREPCAAASPERMSAADALWMVAELCSSRGAEPTSLDHMHVDGSHAGAAVDSSSATLGCASPSWASRLVRYVQAQRCRFAANGAGCDALEALRTEAGTTTTTVDADVFWYLAVMEALAVRYMARAELSTALTYLVEYVRQVHWWCRRWRCTPACRRSASRQETVADGARAALALVDRWAALVDDADVCSSLGCNASQRDTSCCTEGAGGATDHLGVSVRLLEAAEDVRSGRMLSARE
eukprot:ctg_1424.g429